jgi:catechol 2,3-dioxygenase-like lactoylglutathione lyase family enzyme
VSCVDHVGITVADLDRAIRLYVDVFECRVLRAADHSGKPQVRKLVGVPDADLRSAMLEAPGGHRIELVMYHRPRTAPVLTPTNAPGAVHLAFQVRSIQETLASLRAEGGTTVSEPVELSGGRFVYCRDPDGVMLELIEPAGSTTRAR